MQMGNCEIRESAGNAPFQTFLVKFLDLQFEVPKVLTWVFLDFRMDCGQFMLNLYHE